MFKNDTTNVEEALNFAIDAIDHGDMERGSAAPEWVLQREPENQIAWLWMACTVPDENAKRGCYIQIRS